MKIVHIVTQDFGGAGNASYRVFAGLKALGQNVKMIVAAKKNNDDSVLVLNDQPIDGSYTTLHNTEQNNQRYNALWEYYRNLMNGFPDRPEGLEIFTDTTSLGDYAKSKDIVEADIINLHWMAGFINYETIIKVFKDKPIVWTLHDMNAFTGGCHYAGECLEYKNNCGACPQLGSDKENDITREIWNLKENAYKNLDITVVTPSKWLGKCSEQSSHFSRFPHHVIPYGFPLDKFFPKNRESLRTNLNIPLDKKVILFGADNILNERKGLKYFLHALSHVISRRSDVALAFFGAFHQDFEIPFEVPVYKFGSVHDEMKLSAVYSLADVFVIPSLEDNLPNTVVESMASGTPVVGFDIGGIPDMVEPGVTGELAKFKDVESLAAAIERVLDNPDYSKMRENCVKKAETEYTLTGQAQCYVDLYNSILERRNKKPGKINKPVNIISSEKDKLPVISVVTPSYNQGNYIEECIDSVLSQNYPNLEYIVIDGGSNDNTPVILEKYKKYFKYWKSSKDKGQYFAIDEGFLHTTGEIMTWLNSDDIFYPGAFSAVASAFINNKNIKWLSGRGSVINKNNNMSLLELRRWAGEDLLSGNLNIIQQEGTFWKRELWEKSGAKIDTSYKLAADFELWTRFFKHEALHTLVYLTAGFRKHNNQKTGNEMEEYNKEAGIIFEREKENPKSIYKPSPAPVILDKGKIIKTGNDKLLSENIDKLEKELETGNISEALTEAKKVFTQLPDNTDMISIVSDLCLKTGNNIEAKAVLWNGIFRFPRTASFYDKLISIELNEKRYDNIAELNRLAHDYEIVLPENEKIKEALETHKVLNLLLQFNNYYNNGFTKEADIIIQELIKLTGISNLTSVLLAENNEAILKHIENALYNDAISELYKLSGK